MHEHIGGGGIGGGTVYLYVLLTGLWLAYIFAVLNLQAANKPWKRWRTLSWTAGLIAIAIALYPSIMHEAHFNFQSHMGVHLLLGMFAPLGLVFAAPVTLALQTLPLRIARQLLRILSWRISRLVSHPLSAAVLNVGGMYLLYLTPLYELSTQQEWLSGLVHWHFLAAGYLYVWSIAGPDRAPRRPGLEFRLLILFMSVSAHATLSKIIYAYGLPHQGSQSYTAVQNGAQLMYYGGALAELILVIGFFAIWFGRNPSFRFVRSPV